MFSLFVVYGTTFPFEFNLDGQGVLSVTGRINWRILGGVAGDIIVSDIVQNILLFIPFGFLGYFSLIHKRSKANKIGIVAAGAALSATVECLQMFSPLRYPALSDVVFNTLGTAAGLVAGIALKKSILGFKSNPDARKFLDAGSAFPAFIFLVLVVAGCWEPFDFSLDVGMILGHVKALSAHPFRFTRPDDDMIAFIRYLLCTLFVCRMAREAGLRRPVFTSGLTMGFLALGLEATQIIIQSRSPEFQDAVVALLGITAGVVVTHFPPFHLRPRIWAVAGALAVFLSDAIYALHPFKFSPHFSGFNLILFLPQFQESTFASMSNFVENGMIFFPMGFLLAYFLPRLRPVRVSAAAAGVMALMLETAQGFVPRRYPDLTDVLGAVLGAAAGGLALTRGWPAFREYMAEDQDSQV